MHGIPGARVLRDGDVVKLDVTLELDGYMADSAVTVVIPPVSVEARQLQRAARIAFNRGLAVARAGTSAARGRSRGGVGGAARRRRRAFASSPVTASAVAFTSRRVCPTGRTPTRAPCSRKGS